MQKKYIYIYIKFMILRMDGKAGPPLVVVQEGLWYVY
jgi:hypothetical protein